MKILVDLAMTKIGGGKNYALNQLDEIAKIINKKAIRCICSNEEIEKYLRNISIETIRVSNNPIILIFQEIIIFIRNILIGEYCLQYSLNNYVIPLLLGKYVTLYQNVKVFNEGVDKKNNKETIKYYFINKLSQLSLHLSKKNIFVSNHISKLTAKNIKIRKKNIVIYSGFKENTIIRKIEKKKNNLLSVSSGSGKQKNINILIDSIKHLKNRVILKIAGKVTLNNSMNIELLGYLKYEDLQREYQSAYIYISPSTFESFNFTPMEAMSCGTPCILSDIPVHHEIYGKSALYFNPYSAHELSKKIELLLDDKILYDDLVQRGYKQIQKYSWKKNAEELVKVFEEISGQKLRINNE